MGLVSCSVTQNDPVVCVADVEEITLSLFSPFVLLFAGEVQVLGFHILIELVEVYVGQEGADNSSLGCPCKGFFDGPLVHHPGTQEFPEQVSDIPVRYSLLDRLD